MDWKSLIRENIKQLIPYSSARSEFTGEASIFIDANENPYDEMLSYNRYPDSKQMKLKEAISKFKGLNAANLFLGNGSDEIVDTIIRVFCVPGEDNIVTSVPSFKMYSVAAALNDVDVHEVALEKDFLFDVDKMLSEINQHTRVVFLCTPNNPTGNSISSNDIKRMCSSASCIVVVDEAYIDFSDVESATSLINEYDNLIVLQTLSKALGGAGLRVGIAISHNEMIAVLNKVKMPYNISQPNQEAAIALLSDTTLFKRNLEENKTEKEKLIKAIKDIPCVLKIYPSDTNFILVKFSDAQKMYDFFISNGFVVRNVSNYVMCEGCLRITVGTPDENISFVNILKAYNQ